MKVLRLCIAAAAVLTVLLVSQLNYLQALCAASRVSGAPARIETMQSFGFYGKNWVVDSATQGDKLKALYYTVENLRYGK